jgi:hypothetical protein
VQGIQVAINAATPKTKIESTAELWQLAEGKRCFEVSHQGLHEITALRLRGRGLSAQSTLKPIGKQQHSIRLRAVLVS